LPDSYAKLSAGDHSPDGVTRPTTADLNGGGGGGGAPCAEKVADAGIGGGGGGPTGGADSPAEPSPAAGEPPQGWAGSAGVPSDRTHDTGHSALPLMLSRRNAFWWRLPLKCMSRFHACNWAAGLQATQRHCSHADESRGTTC